MGIINNIQKKLALIIALALLGNGLAAVAQEFYKGVDLSYVNELENHDVKYFNAEGTQQDPYTILADAQANLVRLRLWHNPQWTAFSNLADVTKAMQRAKDKGMQVLLDFHYSDFWTDPTRQWCPAAWNNVANDSIMGDSVYNYTYKTLQKLHGLGLLPALVQIGNETNGNILIKRNGEAIDAHSPGMSPINWHRQVFLLNQGIKAVKQFNAELSTQVKTVIHVAQPENALWWFRDAIANGLTDFDIMGLSYYPEWSDHDVRKLGETVKFLTESYQKDLMVVEIGYPWTTKGNDNANNILGNNSKMDAYDRQISNEVQRDVLVETAYIIKENGGMGMVYWEPAWVASSAKTYWATGSHYENCALFDFENKLNKGADYLSYDYSKKPEGLADKSITFSVNMKGENTDNGVFITGDFSGDTWQFVALSAQDNDWYSVSVNIPGRSVGAFIFYNNNEWNDAYRETVPVSCATWWGTHRGYLVGSTVEDYRFSWSNCGTVAVNEHKQWAEFEIYPLPAQHYLSVNGIENIQQVAIFNLLGQRMLVTHQSNEPIDVSTLDAGTYILLVSSDSKQFSKKFIKK